MTVGQALAKKQKLRKLRRDAYLMIFLIPPLALFKINQKNYGLDFSEKVALNIVLFVYVYALISYFFV